MPASRHAFGTLDGWHLLCARHRLVVLIPCGWWGREAGSEQRQESPHAAGFLQVVHPEPSSRDEWLGISRTGHEA
jgi:hypothetical protein